MLAWLPRSLQFVCFQSEFMFWFGLNQNILTSPPSFSSLNPLSRSPTLSQILTPCSLISIITHIHE
ncbi:rCG59290 [Rattus norvegicus]|uniref:RCG59290 n=1 Tax=Rattus norvegicus TaxID=10116 RepID=A6K7S3_RAT|nr:rCG59290 [Rattus norvegicus]